MKAAALAALVALVACSPGGDDVSAPTVEERSSLTPLTHTRFEEATPEQLELRATADSALRVGDEDTAMTALLSLARSEPMSEPVAVASLLLSQLYHRRGDAERSLQVLEDVIAWAPPSAEMEFVHASALLDLGRDADAVSALVRAVRVDPDFIRAYPMLAAVNQTLGREDDADQALLAMERRVRRLGRDLDGDATPARKLEILGRLRIGFAHADVARATANALDDDDPDVVAEALRTLARVGTVDVREAVAAVADGGGASAELAAAVLAEIDARSNPE